MSKKTDNSTLEEAEELSEFELQKVQGGSKSAAVRHAAKEESAKKTGGFNREEGAKKQVSTSMSGNPEGIKKI